MIELIYLAGTTFTFLYAIWRGAAREQLHDPLEWLVSAVFAIVWPLTWVIVWFVKAYFEARRQRK